MQLHIVVPPRSPQEALLLGALMPNPSWDLSGPSEHRSWTQSGSCLVLREPQADQWAVKPSAMQDVQVCFPLSAALCGGTCHALINSGAPFTSESSSVQFPGWQQYPNSHRGAECRGGKTICDWKQWIGISVLPLLLPGCVAVLCYQLPQAAVTKYQYHRLGGLKDRWYFLTAWRLEILDRGVSRVVSLEGSLLGVQM